MKTFHQKARIIRAGMVGFLIVSIVAGQATEFPGKNWEVKMPEEVGLNSTKLDAFSARAGGDGCIVRDGFMVETWGNYQGHKSWASASKPVLSTLLMLAVKEGRLPGVDAPVKTAGWALSNKDEGMTFRHLADMVSGYARAEAPGAAWAYNDYAIQLYALSLQRIYNEPLDTALNDRLADLQFEDGRFFGSHNGLGVEASPRDFARLGWLWLNGGRWNGKELIPERLFTNCVHPDVPRTVPRTAAPGEDYLAVGTYGGSTDQTPYGPGVYGFNFWFNAPTASGALTWPGVPADTYQANGMWNRDTVTMFPSLHMVVVVRGAKHTAFEPGQADGAYNENLKLLVEAAAPKISDLTNTPPAQIVVRPDDTGEALVNPDMGWTFQFYSDNPTNYGSELAPSDTLEDWPGLSVVYMRMPWAYLEPKESQFNWALFDTPAQRWIAKGKKIALRVTCSESRLRYATPEWVKDAGAKGVEFDHRKGPRVGGALWDPDFLDPVFLDKLDHFLAAFARRYDGNPNVAFVDMGSFGMWGEGHTTQSSHVPPDRTLEAVRRHIDLYCRHFKKTLLCINDDVAGPNKPGLHFPATDYALRKGMTLRDDSILVHPAPRAWFHDGMAQAFWPTLPVVLEHGHYATLKTNGAWADGSQLLKAVEAYHASYMSIHGWPREELDENRDLVNRINRRMGYRLQLREMSWPRQLIVGQPFTAEAKWADAGVAPCYPGGFWAMTLKDASNGIVAVNVAEDLNLRDLKPAAPDGASVVASTLHGYVGLYAPTVQPDVYDVFVSVGLRDGTPVFELPLAQNDGQRRYKVGKVRIVAASPP